MTKNVSNSHNSSNSDQSSPFFSKDTMLYFIKHSPGATAIFDTNMVYLACSDQYLLDYNLPDENIIGKCHYDVFPEIPENWKDVHQRTLEGSVEKNEHDLFKRLDGSTDYVHWECRPWYEPNGNVGGIILYSKVINEQVELLQAAKKQTEREKKQLETVLANINTGVLVVNQQEAITHINESMAKIMGLNDRFHLPHDPGNYFKSLFSIYSYPDRKELSVNQRPLARLHNGELFKNKKCIIKNIETGRERILEYSGSSITNSQNETEIYLLTADDITERESYMHSLEVNAMTHRALFQHSPLGMFLTRINDWKILDVNDAVCNMYGYTHEEMLSLTPSDYVSPSAPAQEGLRVFSENILHNKEVSLTSVNIRKDGSPFPVEVFATPIEYYGEPCVLSMINDISERETHLRLLKESERTHRALFEESPLAMIVTRLRDMLPLDINSAACKMYGYTHEEMLSLTPSDYLSNSKEGQQDLRTFTESMQKGKDLFLSNMNIRKDGSTFPVELFATPIVYQGEKCALAMVNDITRQKQAEDELRKTRDLAEQEQLKWLTILDNVDTGVEVYDRSLNRIYINKAEASILGYSCKEDMLAADHDFLINNFDVKTYPEYSTLTSDKMWPVHRAMAGERVIGELYSVRRMDRHLDIIVRISAIPVMDGSGTINFVVLAINDITERISIEDQLRKSKELAEQERLKYETILDHVTTAVGVYDSSAKRIYSNDAMAHVYGFKHRNDMLQQWQQIAAFFTVETYPESKLLEQEDWPTPRALRGEELKDEIFCVRRLDKEDYRIVSLSAIPVRDRENNFLFALLVSNDITEQIEREEKERVMQKRMEETQRLESLGVLAGGIAHDFNNLLQAILGHADLAEMKLSMVSQTNPIAENLKQIRSTSARAADLCTQLLAYSGQGRTIVKDFSLNKLTAEIDQILTVSISRKCILNCNMKENLPLISGDSSQMQQLLMNFIINASEAIGDQNGTIDITTGTEDRTLEYFTNEYLLKPEKPGLFVTLEVSDNGPGMDKDTLGHIFDPFYTTKFLGRGLGLSAVLGIVRSHAGGLKVTSQPGVGTSFKVYLPAVDSIIEDRSAETAPAAAPLMHFSGTVLLVDDEAIVRISSAQQLINLGLTVLEAADGQEGVDTYSEHKDNIDLVIMDLAMPKMNGEEAYQQLVQLDPDVRVVFASGYAESDVRARFKGKKIAGFLSKPFSIGQLSGILGKYFSPGK